MRPRRPLFRGRRRPLPEPVELPRRSAAYEPEPAVPARPVLHADGYDAFVRLLDARGDDPRLLSRRPDLLVVRVQELADDLAGDADLRRAAAVFWGNALVATRRGSSWDHPLGAGPMVWDGHRGPDLGQAVDALVGVRTAADAGVDPCDYPPVGELAAQFHEEMVAWMSDPAWVDPLATLGDPVVTPDLAVVAAGYRRPHSVAAAIVEDARRYPPRPFGEMPSEDEYSRTTRVGRYEPLHEVADALIEHLTSAFVCTVREATGEPAGATAVGVEALHATVRDVVVSTGLPRCADLRFRVTDYPSVVLGTGAFTEHLSPFCGCDACDESLSDVVEELERTVFTVVGGGFTERLSADGTEQTTRSASTGGGQSGSSSHNAPPDDLTDVLARLSAVSGGWEAWPRRDDAGSSPSAGAIPVDG